MKNANNGSDLRRVLLLCGLLIFTGSCTSRYWLSLYITDDSGRQKIKTEEATLTAGTVLNNPYADTRIILGRGNTVVVPANKRGSSLYKGKADVLSFDEYLKLRIYLQLPVTLTPGRLDMIDNAYVLILERYDKPIEEKVFLPKEGELVIDSIASGWMFMSLNGRFINSTNTSLGFDGKFKLKLTN